MHTSAFKDWQQINLNFVHPLRMEVRSLEMDSFQMSGTKGNNEKEQRDKSFKPINTSFDDLIRGCNTTIFGAAFFLEIQRIFRMIVDE